MNAAQFDFTIFSEYAIAAGIFLMSANLIMSVIQFFLRKDAMYGSKKARLTSNILLLVFEAAFIIFSCIIITNERIASFVSLAMLSVALLCFFMLLWSFIQIRGISAVTMETLETLVGVIEAGDENLDGHSLHVQNLTMLIYDYLPFFERAKINPINLQYASLLLDVGKLGIPRSIIQKTGKLLPKERELIQKHPEICVEIFKHIPSLKTVTHWVKYHHERVDGDGYYHLKGNEIPLASRILALADTYSAITMDRSYRASLPYENAIAELRLVAGSQLDSELVDIFCSIPKKKISACVLDVRNRMKKYSVGDFR
ncbi:MAG: HD domain-containing protein [Treponema sp.]|nr:HD domain-containing protein [Treponema sp.]